MIRASFKNVHGRHFEILVGLFLERVHVVPNIMLYRVLASYMVRQFPVNSVIFQTTRGF